jgi:hypothetical protein
MSCYATTVEGEYECEDCGLSFIGKPVTGESDQVCPTCRIVALETENAELRDSLIGMVEQFAHVAGGKIHTSGISAQEAAFDALGWDDPHEAPEHLICDEPTCGEASTCGTPDPQGYRRTCYEHSGLAAREAIK